MGQSCQAFKLIIMTEIEQIIIDMKGIGVKQRSTTMPIIHTGGN